MITFDNVDRNYDVASKNFSLDIPKVFNFAFDVLDVRAQKADKEALLSIDTASGNVSSVTYSELSKVSAQFGKALLSLGLKKGDKVLVNYEFFRIGKLKKVISNEKYYETILSSILKIVGNLRSTFSTKISKNSIFSINLS